jgi:hypothetical protein
MTVIVIPMIPAIFRQEMLLPSTCLRLFVRIPRHLRS